MLVIGLVLGATACTDESSDTGTVVSITDGDTLVASYTFVGVATISPSARYEATS